MNQTDPINKKQAEIRYKSRNLLLESTNFISELFFLWISPVISYASKVPLEQEAVPDLPPRMQSVPQFQRLDQQIQKQLDNGKQATDGTKLLIAMSKANSHFLFPLVVAFVLRMVPSTVIPILTSKIISYIASNNKTLSMGIFYTSIVLLVKFVENLALSSLFYRMGLLGFNLSNNISLCIFNKALKFPTLCNKKFTVAELVNYTEVDAQRLGDIGWNTSSLVFCPARLIVGTILLYNFIGASFLSGMGVMALVAVLIYFVTKRQTKANEVLLEKKDARMKITTEIFNHIRFIKSNAWQKYYFNKLNRARNNELSKMRNAKMYGVADSLLSWLVIPLSLSATFGTYVWLGNQLTAQVAFSTIVLFNTIEYPMNAIPESIGQLSQIWTSLKRIQKFLKQEEMDYSCIKEEEGANWAIKFERGSFYWEREEEDQKKNGQDEKNEKNKKQKKKEVDTVSESQSETQIKQSLLSTDSFLNQEDLLPIPHVRALRNLNLQIKKGKLTIILGTTGSGKSSLLYSIIGEMKPYPNSCASIFIEGSIAFVPQKAWMMSRSIEDNILNTQPMDSSLFQQSLKYSCLEDDLKELPDREKTIIGERGLNLSGGQKARVSLARALYSDKDIYLLDDIISAVDVHVGNTIIKECLLDYLKGKTVVMVTHAVAFAKCADEIIIMKKGEIVAKGSYEDLKDAAYFKEIEEYKPDEDTNEEEVQEKGELEFAIPLLAQHSSISQDKGQKQTATSKLVEDLLLPEDRSRGRVSLKVYKTYLDLNGGWVFVTVLLVVMVSYATLSVLGSIRIERWCESPRQEFGDLYLYMGLTILSRLFAALRAMIVVFSGIRQGSKAHKKMIKGLMYASIPQFFDRVPTGRILNRLSKDLRELDENIGQCFGGVIISSFGLIAELSVCVYASTLYLLIPVAVFFLTCLTLKSYYMKSQREIVRLETISNSPVITSFTEVINGLPTIRAYNLTSSFIERQCSLVDVNKRNKVCREAMECWFAQRLAFLSMIINVTATAYCLMSHQSNPSMAGLLLAYCFSLEDSIIQLTYYLADLETKMVSIERVNTFMNIESERGYVEYTKKWRTWDEETPKLTSEGRVEFKDFSLKYRHNLPSVLKDLNISIHPREKIGVVGRTGAGKSTLVQSLLRIVEPTEGKLLIDGQDITTIPLKALRTSLTLIAQEPVLIAGSLRENLDPRNQHSDQQLLSALEKCCLLDVFKEREMLDTKISESGQNLSVGEKQLICITRAILRQNRLVLIDQATANIDMASDRLVQQAIRSCFSESTVITIAHRIKTIIDSDRILVMDKGRVAEFDTPERLLQKRGIFYEMYLKSQEEEPQVPRGG